MKPFRIFVHPTLGTEAVKTGFSWPAFFFGFWWSLVKKLWLNALIYFVAIVFLNMFATAAEQGGADGAALFVYLIMLGLAVFWGTKGNDWIASNLQNRGFHLERTVDAANKDAALAQNASS